MKMNQSDGLFGKSQEKENGGKNRRERKEEDRENSKRDRSYENHEDRSQSSIRVKEESLIQDGAPSSKRIMLDDDVSLNMRMTPIGLPGANIKITSRGTVSYPLFFFRSYDIIFNTFDIVILVV